MPARGGLGITFGPFAETRYFRPITLRIFPMPEQLQEAFNGQKVPNISCTGGRSIWGWSRPGWLVAVWLYIYIYYLASLPPSPLHMTQVNRSLESKMLNLL